VRRSVLTDENGSQIELLSYFIAGDQNIFVFHGFCSRSNFDANQTAFRATMDSFDRLRNENARNVKPVRIKVVKAVKGEPLEQFLSSHPSEAETPDRLAIINGMELTDMVKPGDRLKVLTQ
jgi:predicted Zn-dependent protease